MTPQFVLIGRTLAVAYGPFPGFDAAVDFARKNGLIGITVPVPLDSVEVTA